MEEPAATHSHPEPAEVEPVERAKQWVNRCARAAATELGGEQHLGQPRKQRAELSTHFLSDGAQDTAGSATRESDS